MRDYEELQKAGQAARLEKLLENTHKSGFHSVTMAYALSRLKDEVKEIEEELESPHPNPVKVRREFADAGNFADMGILACDREIK